MEPRSPARSVTGERAPRRQPCARGAEQRSYLKSQFRYVLTKAQGGKSSQKTELSSVWLFAFVKAGRHGLWKTGGWPYVSGPEHPAGRGAPGRVSVTL